MTLDKENNCNCKSREIEDMQAKVIELVVSSSLKASENNLESALVWKQAAKLFFGGMVLLNIAFGVYFWLYNTETTTTEEEDTIHYSIEQDASHGSGNNEMSTIDMGDVNYGETENN